MIRLIHAADIHAGLTALGSDVGGTNTRSLDIAASLDRLYDHAIERKAHAVVLAGDVFHGRRPSASDLLTFVRFIRRTTGENIRVLYGSGNHDGPGTLRDVAGKTTGWLAETGIPLLHAYPEPTIEVLRFDDGAELAVASLPYPHKRALEAAYPEASPEERTEMVSRQVESLIMNLAETARDRYAGVPLLFVGHLSVVGGLAGSEATMQIGWDVTVSAHAFDLYDYAALGHLHPQQRISDRAWYAGSPQYVSFGEINQQKGFLYVELDGSAPSPTFLDSATRPMVSFDIADDSASVAGIVDGVPEGAIVRLRLAETLSSDYESRLITAVAGRASFVHKERVRVESAAPRARVEMTPEEGVLSTTKRWLSVNGYPDEPYMTAAQEALAEAAAAKG